MLDALHYLLLSGIVSPFYQSDQNRTADVYEDNAIESFLQVLAYCKENRANIRHQNLAVLGEYYHSIEPHIPSEDLVMVSLVLSSDPERSGQRKVDLRDFVQEIKRARENG